MPRRYTRHYFTPEEDDLIRARYPAEGPKPLARDLGREVKMVTERAKYLRVRVDFVRKWTPQEDALIREKYPTEAASVVARELGRTTTSVQNRAERLGIRKRCVEVVRCPWTAEEDDLIRARYPAEGSSLLAQEFGRRGSTIRHRARRLGLNVQRSNESVLAFIREVYPEHGARPVAERFGLTVGYVRHLASDLGIKDEGAALRTGNVIATRNRSVNIHYFKTWSPAMAYILGYIWGDGSVCNREQQLRFGCVTDDEAILIWIKEQMGSSHPLTYIPGIRRRCKDRPQTHYEARPQTRLTISSTIVVRDLIELHGLRPDKCHIDLPFPNVPEEYLCHFARGHLDADGCVYAGHNRQSVQFLGTPSFLGELAKRISTAAEVPVPKLMRMWRSGALLHQITWGDWYHLQNLYAWLYPEGLPFCLDRKRAKWLAIQARPRRRYRLVR